MPLYQYACQACSHDFEVIQNYNDKRLRKCPECKKLKLVRKFSVPSAYIGPKTVGSLADYNASKMSQDEQNFRIEESRTKRTPRPGAMQKKGKSMFKDVATRRKIMKASDAQKTKFIDTGNI